MANKPKHGRPSHQTKQQQLIELWAGPQSRIDFVRVDKPTQVRIFRSGRYFLCVSSCRVPDGYDWQLAKRLDDNVGTRIWYAVIA